MRHRDKKGRERETERKKERKKERTKERERERGRRMQAKGEAPFRVKVGSARLVTPFFFINFFYRFLIQKRKENKETSSWL